MMGDTDGDRGAAANFFQRQDLPRLTNTPHKDTRSFSRPRT